MRLLLALSLAVLITGCSLLPQKYDNNEYELLTRLEATALIMNENCGDEERIKQLIPRLDYDARVLHTYAFYTPRNTDVYGIVDILKTDVQEFKSQYDKGRGNKTYCTLKTSLFLQKVRDTLEVVGNKPR